MKKSLSTLRVWATVEIRGPSMRVSLRIAWLCCIWCLGWAAPAWAADAIFVDGGASDAPDGWVVQFGARWDWGWQRALGDVWRVGGAWELAVACGRWYDSRSDGTSVDVNFTPEIRLRWRRNVVIEGGVGAHLITDRPNQRLSTAVEFGSLLGIGYRVAEHIVLGYRFLHLSNGGIKQPNTGVNIHLAHVEYRY